MAKPMVISFYCDDTNPYVAPASAYRAFLDFAKAEGIAGESSVIIGYNWSEHGLLSQLAEAEQRAYVDQLQRAYDCGIDSHFELFTHLGRFDFDQRIMPSDAIHEGVWMYEPGVSVADYEAYFRRILDEGERIGLRYSGVTWPGCGCDACVRRYAELRQTGINDPNPGVWQALLHLARQGRFHTRTVPCFFGGALDQYKAALMASEGRYGVFDLAPNAEDRFGLWLNSPEYVNADYYITEDGESGRIVELFRRGEPYCLFYAHWQGLNPVNGVGWSAFQAVVRRVQKRLKDGVVWQRPSQYTDSLLAG